MLKRSRELFRWARERRHESGRFTEPSVFHQLSQRWDPVVPHPLPAAAPPPPLPKGLPPYWQQAVRRHWAELTLSPRGVFVAPPVNPSPEG
jgi:hypothetical protein